MAGGLLGGLGGWLVGIGALAIPGIGPFIAAGAFATALGGLPSAPGLARSLARWWAWECPRSRRSITEGEAKAGQLLTVRADGR